MMQLGHVLGAVMLVLRKQLSCVAAASVSPCQVPAGIEFIVGCDRCMQQTCCFVQRTGLCNRQACGTGRWGGFSGVRKSA
jgi:hypothetical protein